jgi:hypothetical protein
MNAEEEEEEYVDVDNCNDEKLYSRYYWQITLSVRSVTTV